MAIYRGTGGASSTTSSANVEAVLEASVDAVNAAAAASVSEVNAAASAASAANTYDDFDDRYLGAKASDPATDNDGDPLTNGALYFSTTEQEMKVYSTVNGWQGAFVGPLTVDRFTAVGSTDFTLSIVPKTVNNTDVYINGVYQEKNTYTVSGTTLSFTEAPLVDDVIEVTIIGSLLNVNATGSETIALTSGQTSVTFTNSILGATFHLSGDDVDNGRLLSGTDYTSEIATKTITLTQSYPAGTNITMYYGYADDVTVELDPVNTAIATNVASIAINAIDIAQIADGTTDITYNQGGTGAVDTTVKAKLQETVSVKDFGAVGDGVTDDTAAFNAAIATKNKVFVPAGSYVVSNITIISGMHVTGEKSARTSGSGTILRVRGNNAAAFLKDGTSEVQYITIENIQIRSDSSTYTNTRGIYANENTNYIAWANFNNVETWADLETGYSANFIFSRWERCRDGYYGTPYAAGHSAVSSTPQVATQAKRSNTNLFNQCEFFNSDASSGAVHFEHGGLITFKQCDFESLSCEAVQLKGVQGVKFSECWFEGITDTQCVLLTTDTVPEGVRSVVFEGCQFDLASTTSYVVSIGSACEAGFRDCQFVSVGASHKVTNDFTKLSQYLNNEVLSSTANALNFQGEAYSLNTAYISNPIFADRIKPFSVLKSGLTDNPGAPETVATFTFSAQAETEAQRGELWVANIEATVLAVGTTTTIHAYNTQQLRMIVNYDKNTDVLEVTLNSVATDNLSGGGGTWTSVPVWSATVSGSDVVLKVTSNPGGTSYAGGISATVTGMLHDQTTLNVLPNGAETEGTRTSRTVTIA